MNDLSNAAVKEQQSGFSCKPIPSLALYILLPLFFIGLSVSIFILVVVHNAAFLLSFLLLSALVTSFLAWNALNWRHHNKAAFTCFLNSFPDSDLRLAREGQLVKITGVASCGSLSLETSYERVGRCIYTSTLLYEYGQFGLKPVDVNRSWFQWNLAYCERFSTDFYITDQKSGVRAVVKAGSGCEVIPLIIESKLVTTTKQCKSLSPHFSNWLKDRNLSAEARLLRLEEGYLQEGSTVTVIGMLHKSNDILMIVQPPEIISTGCLWQRLLLPVDIDGMILGIPDKGSNPTLEEMASKQKVFSFEEVIKRKDRTDCLLLIDGKVYDVTPFLEDHPGGDEVLLAAAGKDATDDFEDVGHSFDARAIMEKYLVGEIDSSTVPVVKKFKQQQGSTVTSYKGDEPSLLIKILQFLVPLLILGFAFGLQYLGKKEKAED
ncbi:hypothetical protein COLO4_06262 [Corchorus olitorius]|uniref:Cytochrome b5 heme-binding domain-containing protein n=1 Tax=Corchorus olitorius TaxID=93759 RepID=A0A1R3KNK1_9ROSI|nr:hypothetical protein COLO4_06262 [Corchorus olitorius]